jgi:ribosomal protein S27E
MSERKGISPNLQGSEVQKHSTFLKFNLQCPKCDHQTFINTIYYYLAIKMN